MDGHLNFRDAKQDYLEYFATHDLLEFVDRLFLPFYLGDLKLAKTKAEALRTSLIGKAAKLGIDHQEFSKALDLRLATLMKLKPIDATTPNALKLKARRSRIVSKDPVRPLLVDHLKRIGAKLAALPKSREKCLCAFGALIETNDWVTNDEILDVMVLLREQVRPELVRLVLNDWISDRNKHNQNQEHLKRKSGIFWYPPSEKFVDWGVARYRFAEAFEIGGFESAFNEFEKSVSSTLLEDVGSYGVRSQCYDLFMISRSPRLVLRIGDAIEMALRRTSENVTDGRWEEFHEHSGRLPQFVSSVATTALASAVLLKLGTSESQRDIAVNAAKWLLEQQSAEGAWCTDYYMNGKCVKEPNIFTTIVACEAIRRAGISGTAHAFRAAEAWLLNQQNAIGFWEEDGFYYSLCTVLVLECLASMKAVEPRCNDPYLATAEGFLRRAFSLLGEDNATSRRLSVIAAHQGVEALVYGLLVHEQKNIWKTHTETVGLREGLRLLQEHLKVLKKLKSNEIIKYRSNVEALAHLRDEVVHKAADVTEASSRPHVEACWAFASKYSREILGFDLLAR